MNKKINIIATIKDGFAMALVNYLSIVAVIVLYLVTIWIPYLNVGTTIAMSSLPAEMAKGSVINPLFIFRAEYRRNMGEFFILYSLMYGAISVGFFFMIIPGIVLAIGWSLALILFVDKDLNALEALRESNRLTYGNKWRICGAECCLAVIMCIAVAIVDAIFGIGHVSWLITIGHIINLVIIVFTIPALYGIKASIYKQLTSGEVLEENKAAAEAE